MTRTLRLGAVRYLNVRPLVYGLGSASRSPHDGDLDITLRFDVPSRCARLLADGEIDLGMVPSITYLDRPGDRIVPGVCIGSEGPVTSVALFTRRPRREIRTIALDASSRTSATLTRVLCAKRFEIGPTFVTHDPDLTAMLARADAALLIGDPALFVDHQALGAEKIDLGSEWTAMTGLPFVWAFWSGRADAADARVVRALQDAATAGAADTDALADAYCEGDPARQAIARRYLRESIKCAMTDRAIDGLRLYYREAHALGLVPAVGPLTFY
jgi:predicted solute-binding protein